MPSLQGWSLEIKLTVPLKVLIYLVFVSPLRIEQRWVGLNHEQLSETIR